MATMFKVIKIGKPSWSTTELETALNRGWVPISCDTAGDILIYVLEIEAEEEE